MPLRRLTVSRLSLALVCACMLLSCRSAHPKDLPGKYRLTSDWVVSTLTLHPDHRMEHEIKGSDGETKTISGSWEFGDGLVSIKPCWAFSQNSGLRQADQCGFGAEVSVPGKVELWIDSDHGLAYQKFRDK